MEPNQKPGYIGAMRSEQRNHPPSSFSRPPLANTSRSSTPTGSGPRYFSSPFLAPLNQQERHESFVQHQKSISNTADPNTALPASRLPHNSERSSYPFSEPPPVNGLSIRQQTSSKVSSTNNRSASATQSSKDQHGVVRQASIGHKAKPALLDLKRPDSTQTTKPYTEPKTPPLAATTIEALNAAIAATTKTADDGKTRPPLSRNLTNPRMPFDSPTSTYSQDFAPWRKSQYKSGNTGLDNGRVSPLEEEFHTPPQGDQSSPIPNPTPHSEKSASSANPLLGLGIEQQGMNKKIPQDMLPPRLNMRAIHDQDSRGSMTSLPDLIKRATRLASNLDRGKTASRLGIWDMFSNTEQVDSKKRESTFSDVLNAFPDPATGTPTKSPRPPTMWPSESKEAVVITEKQDPEIIVKQGPAIKKRGRKRKKQKQRRCCGLSITVFIVLLVVTILVIAAAVIIPVFLIVIPQQHRASTTDLSACRTLKPCQNDGYSVVDNNACSCICVNGFTGHDCSTSADRNCISANISEGDHTYDNATIGKSLSPLLLQATNKLGIQINSSILLSTFASNNLSCASQNKLVQFDTSDNQNNRRLVMIPGLEPYMEGQPHALALTRSTHLLQKKTPITLEARQTETLNNIVFQPSTTATQTTGTATVSQVTPTSSTVSFPKANLTSDQRDFAGLVVLYVLAGTRIPSTAIQAMHNIEQYFYAGALASGNSTVNVIHMQGVDVTANFTQLAIVMSDGRVVGGNSTSN